jgi:hypothetical protein
VCIWEPKSRRWAKLRPGGCEIGHTPVCFRSCSEVDILRVFICVHEHVGACDLPRRPRKKDPLWAGRQRGGCVCMSAWYVTNQLTPSQCWQLAGR